MGDHGYRGQDFIGLHDEVVGDGQNDTQPADTWLHNRLWGNTMWLASEPRMITWSPHIDSAHDLEGAGSDAGIRPFALVSGQIAYQWVEVWVWPGQTFAEVWLVANIYALNSHEFDVRYQMQLGNFVTKRGAWRQGLDGSNDPKMVFEYVRLDFEQAYTGLTPIKVPLKLSIQSDGTPDVADTSSLTYMQPPTYKDAAISPNQLFVDSTAGNPDADSLEIQMLGIAWDNDNNFEVDMLGVDFVTTKGGEAGTVMYPLQPVPGFDNRDRTGNLLELVYFSPRCIGYKSGFSVNSIERMRQESLRPNTPVDSAPAHRQAGAIRKLHARPRCIALGQRGRFTNALGDVPYNSVNYRVCWPFVEGADDTTTLLEETFYVTTEDPRLELLAWLAVINHDSNSGTNINGFETKVNRKTGQKIIVGGEVDGFGKAQFEIEITVEQLVDVVSGGATWASNAVTFESLSVDETYTLMHGGRNPDYPAIARSLEHNWQNFKFAHKEGGLILAEDEPYVQPVSFRMRLGGIDTLTEYCLPFRLKMTARHKRETHSFAWDNEVSGGLVQKASCNWDIDGVTQYGRVVQYVDSGSTGTASIRVLPGHKPPVDNTVITRTGTASTITVNGAVTAIATDNDYLREDEKAGLEDPGFRIRMYLGSYSLWEWPVEPGA